MNDRPASNARCLVADDGLMSVVWCKYRFQPGRSKFSEKFVRFKGYRANDLLKNLWLNLKVGYCGN